MQIECKSVPEATVLEAVATMTIPEIPAYAAKIIPMLLAEAESRDMAVIGPCVFTYEGCDGSIEREFTMRVAFPVDGCRGDGAFVCTQVPAHECLSASYRGPMSGLGTAWSAFSPLALRKGKALLPIGREVYLHWIDPDSPENQVELQIPLSA